MGVIEDLIPFRSSLPRHSGLEKEKFPKKKNLRYWKFMDLVFAGGSLADASGIKMKINSDWFGRFVLPGLAFKAVVIGGGYATGRELASFFLSSGPKGGLYGMILTMLICSLVCALTFMLAWRTGSRDYRSFFRQLLGKFWPAFEVAYCLALMVTLAVFAAASGAIGHALFGWSELAGALCLAIFITLFAMFGNDLVERLFKYVSLFLYTVYAVFIVLSLWRFGGRIDTALSMPVTENAWAIGSLSYAAYNVVGAVVILPMLRHLRTSRDAMIAGCLAGPLAMIPAILFFVSMTAFYPAIVAEPLPSDYLLRELHVPAFRIVFQLMIFAALLEGGVGGVHAINERIAGARRVQGRDLSPAVRLAVTATLLTLSIVVATKVGLIHLVAEGYQLLAYAFLLVFLVPLILRSLWDAYQSGMSRKIARES
jgi:uncharacterized membrane protein YkvI